MWEIAMKQEKWVLEMYQLICGFLNSKNLIECQTALDLSMQEVRTLIINSFKSSFLKDEKKREWIEQL